MKHTLGSLTALIALSAVAATNAHGATFAPAQGQTAEQQSKDLAACQTIAVQQSGFDPASPQAPAAAPRGERARGAARGAAVGAAAGAIGGDAGKGAAAGAAAGTVAGGVRTRRAAQEQQAAATQGRAGYDKALAGCMQGKGYSVR
jgi:hypothetical protein